MRTAGGLLVLFCLVTGCSDKDGIPSGIIPKEEMGKILWDMVQADQYSSIYLAKDSLDIGATPAVPAAKPITGSGKLPSPVNGKPPVPGNGKPTKPAPFYGLTTPALPAKNLNASRHNEKDSIRMRHIMDSVKTVRAKDSARTAQRKDSFRLGLKMKDLALYQQVFLVHHVSREEFRKSFEFYLDHPDITKTLLDSVLARGNRLRMESYNTPPPHPDSTKKSPVNMPGASGIGSPKTAPVLHPGFTKRRFPVTPKP